jgi:hypothetical protein
MAAAQSVIAQWPSYPTPGVPRTPDGKPNLTAPTPRTADGKVDFSGIWMRAGGGGGRGRAGAPPAPTTTPDGIPLSTFGEVAGRGYQLPMQPWAAELKKKRMADNNKDNPDVWCLPIGLMQYHNHPQPRQIVHTKNLMLITYESNYGLRYIYLDGRRRTTTRRRGGSATRAAGRKATTRWWSRRRTSGATSGPAGSTSTAARIRMR